MHQSASGRAPGSLFSLEPHKTDSASGVGGAAAWPPEAGSGSLEDETEICHWGVGGRAAAPPGPAWSRTDR